MIRFFVDKNQVYNFFKLKEPIVLENEVLDNNHFEVYYPANKLIINTFRTYSTVEIKTKRKVFKLWIKKILKKQ